MKILYFHQHFSTPKGSAGIRSYAMAQALIRNGHSVVMVCGSFGNGQTGLTMPFDKGRRRGFVDGIDVIELQLAYSNQLSFFKRILLFLAFAWRSILISMTEKYDLVFATTTPLTAGIPGIFARWIRQKPFVFEVRDLWPELPKAMGVIKNPVLLMLMSCLEWISYRSAHRLIGLSPGIVNGIAKRGVSLDRIRAIPNGCDLNIFDAQIEPWRPDQVLDTDLLAIFTGTHGLANGLDALIDVSEELNRRGRVDIKIGLFGNGMQKNDLQKKSADLGLKNIIFYDPIPKKKLAQLMAGADIGLQILANIPAFYYGTSPNKFFDYISAGLPVLNNYPGWLADLIVSTSCGFAIEPKNTIQFADSLEQAADHRAQLRLMGKNARQLAYEQFNREKLSADFVAWLEGAI